MTVRVENSRNPSIFKRVMIHEKCPDCLKRHRLVCLDLETTGLSIQYNTIIELGVIEVVDGMVKREYAKLFGGGHSSLFLVKNVHHISNSERRGKPTFAECAERISSFLSGSILITHNGNSFDIPMIQHKLTASGFPLKNFRSIDTLQLVRKMRKAMKVEESSKDDDSSVATHRNTLENLCAEFGLAYGGDDGSRSHRGLEDAEATLDLLFHLINSKLVEISL